MMPWMERVFLGSLLLALLFALPLALKAFGAMPGGQMVTAECGAVLEPRPPLAGNFSPAIGAGGVGQAAAGAVN